jgi:hypothetical protein
MHICATIINIRLMKSQWRASLNRSIRNFFVILLNFIEAYAHESIQHTYMFMNQKNQKNLGN